MVVLNDFKIVQETVAGPGSYQSGTPPTVVMDDLTQVEGVLSIFIDDGRVAQVVSLVGQTVTFRVRAVAAVPSGDNDAFRELTNGFNLGGSNITVLAYGR